MIQQLERRSLFDTTIAAGFTDWPRKMVVAGDVGYFIGAQESTGAELWRTDGTTVGTALVRDLTPGKESTYLIEAEPLGSRLVFTVSVPQAQQIWITDGTAAGTQMLKSFAVDYRNNDGIDQLTAFGKYVYFRAGGDSGHTLWRSNGTVSGTSRQMKDQISSNETVQNIIATKQMLFILDGLKLGDGYDAELWATDTLTTRRLSIDGFQTSDINFRGTDAKYLYFTDNASLKKSDGIKTIVLDSTGGWDVAPVDDDTWRVFLNDAPSYSSPRTMLFGSHGQTITTKALFYNLGEDPIMELVNGNIFAVMFDQDGKNPTLIAVNAATAESTSLFTHPTSIHSLLVVGDQLYFHTHDNDGTWYRTDGTVAGTGIAFSRSKSPMTGMPVLNGRIFQSTQLGDAQYALTFASPGTGTIKGRVFADPDLTGMDTGVYLSGHRVYLDLNHNARPDTNEPSARTTSKGMFQFDGLLPGTYDVRVVPVVKQQVWSTPGFARITVKSSGSKMVRKVNFGIGGDLVLGSISGMAYIDRNGDHVRQSEEPLLKNATISLGNSRTTLTDRLGRFAFRGLSPIGPHYVMVSRADYASGGANVSLKPGGAEYREIGITPLHRLTVRAFNDLDADGTWDSDEPSIANLPVKIWDFAYGSSLSTSVDLILDESGLTDMRLSGFGSRSVSVYPTSETEWRATASGGVVNAAPDGHSYLSVGFTQRPLLSVGVYRSGSGEAVPGKVFIDLNGDGHRTSNEPQKTLEDGQAEFRDLEPGAYSVRIIPDDSGLRAEGRAAQEAELKTGSVTGVVFQFARPDASIRVRLHGVFSDQVVSLTGERAWLDLDKDGIQDSSEPVDTSDSAGYVHFTALMPGDYQVRFITSTSWQSAQVAKSTVSESGSSTKAIYAYPR